MLEEKVREVFADMVVLKDPQRSEYFSNLSIPSYMRDWLVMKFSDDEGVIDYDSVRRYIKRYIPNREDFEQYDVLAHMGADYPPAFLVACEDDPTVPVRNSRMMDAKLAELGVPHETLIGRTGGHSFGVGIGTDVEGWMERAVAFWQAQG